MIHNQIKILENALKRDVEMKYEVRVIRTECLEFQQFDSTYLQNSKSQWLIIKIMEMNQMQ